MNIKNIVTGIFLLLCITLGVSQDIHFTQFNKAQLNVNPAYTGSFEGTARINGVYRDQYRGIGEAFKTYNLSLEYNIPFAFRDQDWIAGGVKLYGDESGSVGQKMSLFALNLAYHLSLDKKQTKILTLGAQYGTGNISYSTLDANSSASGLGGNGQSANVTAFNTNAANNEVEGGSLNDLVIGTLFTNKGKKSTFNLGLAVEGILKPDRAKARGDKKPLGINVSSELNRMISKKSSWTVAAWFYSLGPANALNVHGKYNMQINPEKDMWLSFGVGTRSLNSVLLLAGIKIQDIDVGLAYDWTVSGLNTASSYGALELGVTYVYKHYKKPEPKALIYCPRL